MVYINRKMKNLFFLMVLVSFCLVAGIACDMEGVPLGEDPPDKVGHDPDPNPDPGIPDNERLGYVALWSRGKADGQLGLGTGTKTREQLDNACKTSAALNGTASSATATDPLVIASPENYIIKSFVTSNNDDRHTAYALASDGMNGGGGYTHIADLPLRGPHYWDDDTSSNGKLGSADADISYTEFMDSSMDIARDLEDVGIGGHYWSGVFTDGRSYDHDCTDWSTNVSTDVSDSIGLGYIGTYNIGTKGRMGSPGASGCALERHILCIAFDKP